MSHRHLVRKECEIMNVLSFPGLGLEFELDRVAFTFFGQNIYWYGIIIACGFLLAVAFGCGVIAPKFRLDGNKLLDVLFVTVPAALIGARLYYVLFYLDLYIDQNGKFDWLAAVSIRDGGLAIYGGLIAAVLVAIPYCKIRKQPFWSYTDTACFGFLIGQLVGRWGNFVNIEAYGGITTLPWRMCSPKIARELLSDGQIGMEIYEQILDGTVGVHPTFFYESLWNLVGFGLLLLLLYKKGRRFEGQIFAGYVIWYGVGRTIIEGLRTDSLYFFGTGLRTSQLVGIISAAVALVFMIVKWRLAKPELLPENRMEKETEEETEHGGDQN